MVVTTGDLIPSRANSGKFIGSFNRKEGEIFRLPDAVGGFVFSAHFMLYLYERQIGRAHV